MDTKVCNLRPAFFCQGHLGRTSQPRRYADGAASSWQAVGVARPTDVCHDVAAQQRSRKTLYCRHSLNLSDYDSSMRAHKIRQYLPVLPRLNTSKTYKNL